MGLRERLAARGLPSAPFALRVEDDTDARAELAAARAALVDNQNPTDAARERVQDAEKALEGCYEQVTLRALAPADYEALVSAHPPDAEHPDDRHNRVTFPAALLAECVESDVTEADWLDWMNTATGPLSQGELNSLWEAVQVINNRYIDGRIPKD